ncbi:MAG: glycosyltransferase family 39 protein, partial [Bacteroidota bacterium]
VNEFAVRLVPAVFGILGLLVAWWLGTLCFGHSAGRWAPPVLGSSLAYFVLARIPIIDMMFSVLLASALTAWLAGEHQSGARRYRWWLASGVLLGASLLAKGLVAPVLFATIVIAYLLWARKPRLIIPGVGLPVALSVLIFLPWALAAQAAYPGFFHFFIIVQHVQRFLGARPEHVEPFYFFILLLPLMFGLWSLHWYGMLKAVKPVWRRSSSRLQADGVFLGIWFAVILLFFSASTCKLLPYILPAWWPLAVVTAAWLHRRFCAEQPRRRLDVPTLIGAICVALFVVAAIVLAGRQQKVPPVALQSPLLVLGGAGLISFGLLLFTSLRSNRHWNLAQLTIAKLILIASLLPAVMAVCSVEHMNDILPAQLKNLPASSPWVLAQYRSYNQSFSFYTGHRVVLIDAVDELVLGPAQPDGAQWFRKGEQAIEELSAKGPLALVTRVEDKHDIARRHHLRVWNSNQDRAMLVNETGWRLLHPSLMNRAPAATLKPAGVYANASR